MREAENKGRRVLRVYRGNNHKAEHEQCDEDKPSCQNCIKHGVECPGYERGFKFVAARTHRRKRVITTSESSTQLVQRTSKSPSEGSSTGSSNDQASDGIDQKNWEPSTRRSTPPIVQTLKVNDGQCLAVVVDNLFQSPSQNEIRLFFRVFSFLPDRVGRSRVLDSSIRCFALHHLGKMNNDERLIHAARSTYVEALVRLQRALDHRHEWASSETMASGFTLCMYELFACPTAYNGWMKHAAGMGRLAQLRGTSRFQDPFDRIIFIALRGIWLMDALFSGKDCFLAEPEWQSVVQEPWDPLITLEQHKLMEEITNCLSFFPALVKDGVGLQDAAMQGQVDLSQIASLTNRGLELYYRLKPWYSRWTDCVGAPKDMPSRCADPLFPVVSEYPSYVAATACCSYYACMIMIHELLKVCGYPQDFSTENSALVTAICKAIEYNGYGTFGPYRMGFSVRIAMEVADPVVKRWLINWLAHASKTYAVTAPDNYPTIEDTPTLSLLPSSNPGRLRR